MRRNRLISRARTSASANTLAKLARRLSESGSRIEDRLWERRLIEAVNDRLARGFADDIEAALEDLSRTQARAYDDLADLAESCAESATVEIDGKPHDALLLAVPLLAWALPAAGDEPCLLAGRGDRHAHRGPSRRPRHAHRRGRLHVLDRPVAGVLRRGL
jgi:hypothetical protein